MKKLLLPLLLLAMAACKNDKQAETKITTEATDTMQAPADSNPVTAAGDMPKNSDEMLGSIRQKVEHINTIEPEKKHFEFMCDEKTMADYFYENGEIVKISVDFGTVGDVYAKEDYYYDKGKLVFIYEFTEGGPACEGCIKTNEYRSYILNDRTMKYLKNKDKKNCKKCEFDASARQYRLLKASTTEQVKAILCR